VLAALCRPTTDGIRPAAFHRRRKHCLRNVERAIFQKARQSQISNELFHDNQVMVQLFDNFDVIFCHLMTPKSRFVTFVTLG
jgi:hypothetical protein